MNKPLLALAALAVFGVASMTAQVTIEGSDTEYTSVSEAVKTLTDATPVTIHVNSSYTETASIAIAQSNTRNITVEGAEGVVISYGGIFLFNQADATSSLAIKNLTLKYTGNGQTGRNTINSGRGSLYMQNVTIENANVKNNNGIISLSNKPANIPNAVLDNVKFVNCQVVSDTDGQPVAQVVIGDASESNGNNNNLVLKGDCELSLLLRWTSTVKDASELTGNVELVFNKQREMGSVVVNNCTNPTHFTLSGSDDVFLQAVGGNLVLAKRPAIVNQTTGATYTDLKAAVEAAEDGNVILLNESVTLNGRPQAKDITLTIKGAEAGVSIIRGENFNNAYQLFLTQTENCKFTFENLTIDNNNAEISVPLFEARKKASLTLRNVKIINATTTNEGGLIVNSTNPGTWHLDGVTIINPQTVDGEAVPFMPQVTSSAAGNTITGDNSLNLVVKAGSPVDAQNVVKGENPVYVKVVDPKSYDTVVFTNCPVQNPFVSATSGFNIYVEKDGNMYVASVSGVADVAVEQDGKVELFNLQGVRVEGEPAPGLYIRRQGTVVTKILVK